MEYFAFGETFVEEHRSSNNSPYKFNGKELDEETGWYYYGARYYDPRISVWLSVDPLANVDYLMNDEAYINGEHNGGVFNSFNHNSYGYCYQNPVLYVDPNGKQTLSQKFNFESNYHYWMGQISNNVERLNRKVSSTSIDNTAGFIATISGNPSMTFEKIESYQRLKYFDSNGKETNRKNARTFSLHITITNIKISLGEDPANRFGLRNKNYEKIGKHFIENYEKLDEYQDLQITRETLDYGLKGFIDETGIVTTQNMGATISDDNPETINSHVAQKYLDTSDYKKIGKSVIDHSRAEFFKAVSENNPNEE